MVGGNDVGGVGGGGDDGDGREVRDGDMESGGRVERDDGGGVEGARWERGGYVAGEGEGDGLDVGAGVEGGAAGGVGGELAVVAGVCQRISWAGKWPTVKF